MNDSARPAASAGIVAIVGGALLAVGSLLPWAEVSGSGASVTAKGIEGSDGYITLAAGVVAVVVGIVMTRGAKRLLVLLSILAGLMGGGLAVYDAVTAEDSVLDAAAEELAPSFGVSADEVRTVLDQTVDAGELGVSIGIGLYVVIAGGLVALVGGILGLRAEAAEPETATASASATPASSPSQPVTPDASQTPAPSASPDQGSS